MSEMKLSLKDFGPIDEANIDYRFFAYPSVSSIYKKISWERKNRDW